MDSHEVSVATGTLSEMSHTWLTVYWNVLLQEVFFHAIKVGYTIGHSVSLISLTVAIVILCLFR